LRTYKRSKTLIHSARRNFFQIKWYFCYKNYIIINE
jgi:hypothetical protein